MHSVNGSGECKDAYAKETDAKPVDGMGAHECRDGEKDKKRNDSVPFCQGMCLFWEREGGLIIDFSHFYF